MKNVSSKKSPLYTRLSVNILIVAFLSLIILALPIMLRGSSIPPGKEPYLLERLSNEFIQHGKQNFDELSYSGRPYAYPIAQTAMLAPAKALGNLSASIILPIILGMLSIILFYLIIYLRFNDKKLAIISSIILLLSPSVIYSFSYIKEFTFPTFITLLAIYLLLRNKLKFLAYILLISTPLFGIEHAVIALLLLFVMHNKKEKLNAIIPASLIIISLLLVYLPILLKHGFPEIPGFEQHNPLFSIFSDLGSKFGISLFIIFLAFFGLKEIWKEKYAYGKFYLALIAILILLIIQPKFVIYATFIFASLAAIGIIALIKANWESKIIKELTILILVLGLLFSTISFLNNYKSLNPTPAEISSLEFLNKETEKDSVVLSHYTNGVWINSIALRKNIMDDEFFYAPDINSRYSDMQEIFNSRNLNRISSLLEKYKVSYIYLTPEMKQGLAWQSEEEGLLFVLKFSQDSFTKIYSQDGIEIWKVLKPGEKGENKG